MTTPKKKINSKAKGSDYERKVAKMLGTWFEEDFHRVPMSGGLHWGTDNRVAGDITTPVDSKFPFTVECKKREGWLLEQVLKGTGDVEKWWEQSVSDSTRVGLKPMLIFSKNFAPSYLMIDMKDFIRISNHKEGRMAFNYFVARILDKDTRVICDLEDFIKHVTRNDILETFSLD